MSFDKITAEDYGQTITITIKDVDTNAPADVSAYTTAQQIFLKDPEGNTSTAKAAAFSTDGSDGVIVYTLVNGDIDDDGLWHICARVTSGSAVLTSEWETFTVGESPT